MRLRATSMTTNQAIISSVLKYYPATQAIYLFGSWGTEGEWINSDIDLALLLPVVQAKSIDIWHWIALANTIARVVGKEKADLINLRAVNVVLRKEVVMAERRIYCIDESAADEFEMLTISFYQQLQRERKFIIEEAVNSGRFRHV